MELYVLSKGGVWIIINLNTRKWDLKKKFKKKIKKKFKKKFREEFIWISNLN